MDFFFKEKSYFILLKDVLDIKEYLFISTNRFDFETINITEKNNFSHHFILDDLTRNIISRKGTKYELFINFINFNDLKNKSINNKNYFNDINPQTAVFGANNYIINQTNEIPNNINNELNNISFDDETNINTESKEEKNKNKNNLINLTKKTSNELLEIALKVNEKKKK